MVLPNQRDSFAYLGDDQVSVIERGSIEVDQNLALAQFRKLGFLVELKTIEALLTLYSPLFGGCWSHCGLFLYRKLLVVSVLDADTL